MSYFQKDFAQHKELVNKYMTKAQLILAEQNINHDMDKVNDPQILETYETYSEQWVAAGWNTPERAALRNGVMKEALDKHAMEEHHEYNLGITSDAFTIIESVSDWIAAISRTVEDREEIKRLVNVNINKYIKDINLQTVYIKTAAKLLK